MEAAASIMAAVSLTNQLIDTTFKIAKFMRDVKNAPGEIQSLVEDLDVLSLHLTTVEALLKQRPQATGLSGCGVALANALAICKERVTRLENDIKAFQHAFAGRRQPGRVLAAFLVAFSKNEMRDHRMSIKDATSNLQCTVSMSSLFLTAEYVAPPLFSGYIFF